MKSSSVVSVSENIYYEKLHKLFWRMALHFSSNVCSTFENLRNYIDSEN